MNKTNARHLVNFFMIGIAIALGMKAVDWVIPNEPYKVEVEMRNGQCGRELGTNSSLVF